MVALGDAIKIAITADGAKAASEFKRVGASAKSNLGDAEKHGKSFGSTLSKVGVGMVGTGAAIAGGLLVAAKAAGDAQISHEKLLNTIKNSPALVGASVAAFEKQQKAIEGTTVVDDEAVAELQALLGQYKLNQAQIIQITPYVVDLSRKMGIDLNAAAKAVGKSISGSGGALQKMGIVTGVTKGGADNLNKTMVALRGTVGGFANQEGKTFSGQLEIAKNKIHDTEEAIGAGAIPVITKLATVVQGAAQGFLFLDDKTGGAVGTIAAWGSVALIAGGAASVVVGQVSKMGAAYTLVKGKIVGTTAAVEAETVAETEAAAASVVWAEGAAGAAGANELLGTSAVTATGEIGTMTSVLGAGGLVGALATAAVAAGGLGIILGGMWDTNNKGLPKDFGKTITLSTKQLGELSKAGIGATTTISAYNAVVGSKDPAKALADWGKNAHLTSAQMAILGTILLSVDSGTKKATASAITFSHAIDAQSDVMQRDADHLYDIVAATNKVHDAQRSAQSSVLDYKDAVLTAFGAQQDYNVAVKKYGANSAQAALAAEDLQRAQIAVGGALDTARQSALDAALAVAGGSKRSHEFRDALIAERQQFPELAAWIDVYLSRLKSIPSDVNTQVKINGQTVNVSSTGFRSGGGLPPGVKVGGNAAGGDIGPGGLSWVGERGPELIKAGTSGAHVFSNAQSRSLMRGGSGGGSAGTVIQIEHITVVANSPRELFDQLSRGANLGHRIPAKAIG